MGQLGDLLCTLVAEVPLCHAILDSTSVLGIFGRQRLATGLWPGWHLRLSTAWSKVGGGCESSRLRGRPQVVSGYRHRTLGRAAIVSGIVLGHVVRLAWLAEAGSSRVMLQGGVLRVAEIAVVDSSGSQRD
jgi:hypothetical protein